MESRIFSELKTEIEAGDDPVQFSIDILGIEPWDRPAEVMRSVRDNKYTAVVGGHKVSKSVLAACTAIWWMFGPPGSRVMVLSSSASQIKEIIWNEIEEAKRNALVDLPGRISLSPNGGWHIDSNREIFGRSSKEPERVAGISSPRLLIIVDEATGLQDRRIFQALEGNLAGDGHILLLANSTRTTGYLYDAFHTQADRWNLFTISSEETPNYKARKNLIPGLATYEWVENFKEAYGVNSPEVKVRIYGEFADINLNNLIRREWVLAAFDRHDEWIKNGKPGETLSLGADVATQDGPDSSVLAARVELGISEIFVWDTGVGPIRMADKVEEEWNERGGKLTAVIDANGVRAGTAEELTRRKVNTDAYVGSHKTDKKDHYGNFGFKNTRQAALWKLRDGLNPDVGINMMMPRNNNLLKQLVILDWQITGDKYTIMTKVIADKLNQGSMNETDAVAMAWWFEPTAARVSFSEAMFQYR